MPVPFAKLVSVKGSAPTACQGSNRRALFATSESADSGATKCGSGHRQFVPVFLPESTMTSMSSRLRRGIRAYRAK